MDHAPKHIILLQKSKALYSYLKENLFIHVCYTQVVLKIYVYCPEANQFNPDGMTSLIKANLLLQNITTHISSENGTISLADNALIEGYRPFHANIVLQPTCTMCTCLDEDDEIDEEYT